VVGVAVAVVLLPTASALEPGAAISTGLTKGPGGGKGKSAASTASEAKAVAIANATRFLLSIFIKELLKI
jgi:hypothetical protein